MVLDSTRYAIERSVRVLRGMNFWGKIRNAFTDDPQVLLLNNTHRNYDTTSFEHACAATQDPITTIKYVGSVLPPDFLLLFFRLYTRSRVPQLPTRF